MKRILAALLVLQTTLPAVAAPFDGDWKGVVPAVRGCAGGGESVVTLTVSGNTVQGAVHNVGNDVALNGLLNDDGSGSVRIARQQGTIHFGGDHFSLDWAGSAGCARHAEGMRAPAPAPIFADAPNQQTEMPVLFQALCLMVYPDENALADVMSHQGGTPLPADEFTRLLPIEGKHGRGWSLKGSKGTYVLLVSQGQEPSMAARFPNMKERSCMLISNGPAEMDPLPTFRSIKQHYAQEKGIPLLPPITNYKMPMNGAMEAQQVGPSSGIFMYAEAVKPETAPLKEFTMEFRPPE